MTYELEKLVELVTNPSPSQYEMTVDSDESLAKVHAIYTHWTIVQAIQTIGWIEHTNDWDWMTTIHTPDGRFLSDTDWWLIHNGERIESDENIPVTNQRFNPSEWSLSFNNLMDGPDDDTSYECPLNQVSIERSHYER